MNSDIILGLTSYVVLLFSLSVHESAHGWMAFRMGDDTAIRQGRVTLNPLVHIDPIGTLLIPLLQLLGSGIPLLGWAKPTPVGAHNFRKLAQGHILVAAAGPVSNVVLALLFTAGLFVTHRLGLQAGGGGPMEFIVVRGIQLNVALALFNLVPLPPLDGSWVASWGLPRNVAAYYDRIAEPYGTWILLILFVTGVLGLLLFPVMSLVVRILHLIAL